MGYLRVSTAEQAAEGISIAAQREAVRRYCKAQRLQLTDVFDDAGISGRKASNRPDLERALEAVSKSRGVLVVYSLSRLARSLRDTIRIADRLERAGAELALLAEQIDTQTAAGRMFFHVLAALAQFESDITGERTRAALAHKRENGERWCNSPPYGFRWEDGELRPNPTEQRVLRRIRRLAGNGHSVRTIAAKLADAGVVNRNGSPIPFQQVHRLLQRRE
ncbi:MAG: recombinase family protein [Phycisphaerales bacterium]|nr:recombinase family protein [Phycisphaerales bacterium]